MKKRDKKLIIFLLLIILIAIDYPLIEKYIESYYQDYEIGVVERVVDGDTVVVNGSSVRLLGINTPERGELYYEEAKKYLEERVQGEVVKMFMGKEDRDLYDRKLRYLYVGEENINLALVEKGYANYYFPSGKDRNYKEFKEAWIRCIESNTRLCEKSYEKCALCLELRGLDVRNQELIIGNKCDFQCNLYNWSIKDEGRKKYVFGNVTLEEEIAIVVGKGDDTKATLFWGQEEYVWTEKGDSLFIRDANNKLILWHTY